MLPYITEFSSGYHMVHDIYIEPADCENPQIQEAFHAYLVHEVYGGRSLPIVMKHSQQHFVVQPDAGTPIDTLQVPVGLLDEWGIEGAPVRASILLATPETAYQMTQDLFVLYPVDRPGAWEDDPR